MFITLEGIEGSGKTTLIENLADVFRTLNHEVLVTREPGGCALGRELRQMLLNPETEICPEAELFLFLADRAQHVAEVIRPALKRGEVVLCDRYADSTVVYQGYGRGLDIEKLRSLNDVAIGGLWPDRTFVLDMDPADALKRARRRNAELGLSEKELEAGSSEKMVAFVKCKGTCDKAKSQYNYFGIKDCKMAAVVPGSGDKACSFGCMGFGSCVTACQFDAIHVVDGIAVVDKEKCVACGKCVDACPQHLVELVPYKAEHLVQCNSHEKGPAVKAKCDNGCIGCTLCIKQCEDDAIHMDNNLAVIDYEKCTNCGKCAAKCPVKVIV